MFPILFSLFFLCFYFLLMYCLLRQKCFFRFFFFQEDNFTPLPPPPPIKKPKDKKTEKAKKTKQLTPCSQGWQIGVTETECIVWEPFFFERPWEKGEDDKQTPSQFEISIMEHIKFLRFSTAVISILSTDQKESLRKIRVKRVTDLSIIISENN